MTGLLLWVGSAAALVVTLAILFRLFDPYVALLILFIGLPLAVYLVVRRRASRP
jgi:membrane protein implicated in regulation of membrane protease activity